MPSVFDWIQNLGPAGIVLEAILLTIAGIASLLAFILLRRGWRSRLFRRRDDRVLFLRSRWDDILSGAMPPEEWREDRLSCDIVESMLLDRLETSDPAETEPLLRCLRTSGLLDLRIQDARRHLGFRRRHALASLGRMRAPEAVPALADALDDRNRGHVLTAIRGLGRLGFPEAAVPLLDRVVTGQFKALPAVPIQTTLLHCCREQPHVLVPYIHRASPETRPLLARVLGELANGSLDEDDLVLLACDGQAEVRASAARTLATAPLNVALSALGALAEDDEWYVRLRAIVGLGQLRHHRAIPLLVEGLCDPNRFVRLRAATGLARHDAHLEEVIDLAEAKHDRYALQALLSELEASGAIMNHVNRLARRGEARDRAERLLMRVLHLGAHRLLVSTLGAHRERRVRFVLARLLGRSRLEALVPVLERGRALERSPRRQAVFTWVISQIETREKPARRRRKPRARVAR
jgi:HEAT repeat protein